MAQAICESTTFNMQKRSNRPPDASLLALCAKAAALEAEIDGIVDATEDDFEEEERTAGLRRALSIIHDKIMQTPASTMAGLRAKAERISWARAGELDPMDEPATDMRLAFGLVRDLLAMEA